MHAICMADSVIMTIKEPEEVVAKLIGLIASREHDHPAAGRLAFPMMAARGLAWLAKRALNWSQRLSRLPRDETTYSSFTWFAYRLCHTSDRRTARPLRPDPLTCSALTFRGRSSHTHSSKSRNFLNARDVESNLRYDTIGRLR